MFFRTMFDSEENTQKSTKRSQNITCENPNDQLTQIVLELRAQSENTHFKNQRTLKNKESEFFARL